MTGRGSECTATGRLVRLLPPGDDLDELLALVRVGLKFAAQQHVGRRPGPLARQVQQIVADAGLGCSFAALLDALETELARGQGCLVALNRIRQTAIYADRGRSYQVTFKTVRNLLTEAKKANSGGPLNRERGK